MDCVVDAQKSANEAPPRPPSTPKHRSIAWCRLAGIEDTPQGWELTDESPLLKLSQNHAVDVADGETTSESSFLGSQRDTSGFADKLAAARDTVVHDTKTRRFTNVVNKVVEKSRFKPKGRDLSDRDAEEGASESGPHLPSQQELWGSRRVTSSPSQKGPRADKDHQQATGAMSGPKANGGALPPSGLKRKAAPPSKTKKGTAGGLGLNNTTGQVSFELSDDSSNDEQSEKRANIESTERKGGRRKVANRATLKKPISKPRARLQQEDEVVTIATTRQRRAAACTTKTYQESLASTIAETPSEPDEAAGKDTTLPRSGHDRDGGAEDEASKPGVGGEEDGEATDQPPVPKAPKVSFGARLSAMLLSGSADTETIQPVQTPGGSKKGLSNGSRSASPRKRTAAAKVASNQTSGQARRPERQLQDRSSPRLEHIGKTGIIHVSAAEPAKQGDLGLATSSHLSKEVQGDVDSVQGKEDRVSSGHDAGLEDEGLIYIDDDSSPGAKETDARADGKYQTGRGRRGNDDQPDPITDHGVSRKRQTGDEAGKYNVSSLGATGKKGTKAERVKPGRMGAESEPADQSHSSSTPVPFHVALERDLRLAQGAASHSEEEQTDPTLVERPDDSIATGGQHQLQQKLRDIFEQMIEDSLLCLSNEQDTIEHKVDWFAAAGQAAIREMQAVWVSKIQHERRKMDTRLQEEEKKLRAAVAIIADNSCNSTLKTQQIEHAARAREGDIAAKLEEIQRQLSR
ncbi:hypothetical protein DV735_g1197, partial [Chaetothyriales sp. CBS 134920]